MPKKTEKRNKEIASIVEERAKKKEQKKSNVYVPSSKLYES